MILTIKLKNCILSLIVLFLVNLDLRFSQGSGCRNFSDTIGEILMFRDRSSKEKDAFLVLHLNLLKMSVC